MGRLIGGGFSFRGAGVNVGPFKASTGWTKGPRLKGSGLAAALVVAVLIVAGIAIVRHVQDWVGTDTRTGVAGHKVSPPLAGRLAIWNSADNPTARVAASAVSCRWVDSVVEVRFTLTRAKRSSKIYTSASVSPQYSIEGHPHGDATFVDIGLPSRGKNRTYTLGAGRPKGVNEGAPITACTPGLSLKD